MTFEDASLTNLLDASSQPRGDTARQAVHALRGFAYQLVATALAWVDIEDTGRIYLEVAEDYAVLAKGILQTVQVKDTDGSGTVTLNSKSVKRAIIAFVEHTLSNPDVRVYLRFFTTSEIGEERAVDDRLAGIAGLRYWKLAARDHDIAPLRAVLESDRFPPTVRAFCNDRSDVELREQLLRMIEWDCGKPGFKELRGELEARLTVVGRDRFSLSSAEAPALADSLVYHVLGRSCSDDDRVLTRADLYKAIEDCSMIPMPRPAITKLLSAFSSSISEGDNAITLSPIVATRKPNWLVDGRARPRVRGTISRPTLESMVARALGSVGIALLTGSRGVGKSTVSLAACQPDIPDIAEFGELDGLDEHATRSRLDTLFAYLGDVRSPVLIIENLNQLHDKHVRRSVVRVIEAARRRYRSILITCYRAPSETALAELQVDPSSVIACPSFSVSEICELVRRNGGDPNRWGRLVHLIAVAGHPQLAHAFALSMAHSRWPEDEIARLIHRGFLSGAIDAARADARQGMLSALPSAARALLYRLSLIAGRFSRSLALTLAEVSPRIPHGGESLDRMIGPWIEPLGNDIFRLSPLAGGVGRQMLPDDSQVELHRAVATGMLKANTIDSGDIDMLLAHALLGKSTDSLLKIAHLLLSLEASELEGLADAAPFLPMLRTDGPIYEDDPHTAILLRLSQFKVAASGRAGTALSGITEALFREINTLRDNQDRHVLDTAATLSVLCTDGVANYIDNWFELLRRAKTLIERDAHLLANMTKSVDDGFDREVSISCLLFSLGIAAITTVARLEQSFDKLSRIEPSERELWTASLESNDYYTIVNRPWVIKERQDTLDAEDAVVRYGRMATVARRAGMREVAIHCAIAQAVMLYEYRDDSERARKMLDYERAYWGSDLALDRALARFYAHCGERRKEFAIYQRIADVRASSSDAEHANKLRDAAISAASLQEWDQANRWFIDARHAAISAPGDDMRAFAIGLGADAAVAACMGKNFEQTIRLLAEAVDALSDVKHSGSTHAAYCHSMVRGAVAWAMGRIMEHSSAQVDHVFEASPGLCSKPDPPAIAEKVPLCDIDVCWYFLAMMEVAAGIDLRIASSIEDRLSSGTIPQKEWLLRVTALEYAIDRLDPETFSITFMKYLEIALYFGRSGGIPTLDVANPKRDRIATLDEHAQLDPRAEQVAGDAIVAYGIRSVIAEAPDAMSKMKEAMSRRFGKRFPNLLKFDAWRDLEIEAGIQSTRLQPYVYLRVGTVLLVLWRRSDYGRILVGRVATWQCKFWKQIVADRAFMLSQPRRTVPLLKQVLSEGLDNERFLASILLVATDAIAARITPEQRHFLEEIRGATRAP